MKEHSLKHLINYIGSIPDVIRFEVVTKLILLALTWSVRLARSVVIWTNGRGSVITGDVKYWITSVQGWIVITITLFLLIMYVIFDINATIILSTKVIHREKISIRNIMKETFRSVRRFRGPFGLFLILFAAFLVPLAGVGMGISLTNGFYIPKFILSYLDKRPMIQTIYSVLLVILILISIHFLFTFHCIIIGKMKAGKAIKKAGKIMSKNRKEFWCRYLPVFIVTLVGGAAAVVIFAAALFGIGYLLSFLEDRYYRILIIYFSFMIIAAVVMFVLLFLPIQMITVTEIYESFTKEDETENLYYPVNIKKSKAVIAATVIVVLTAATIGSAIDFNETYASLDQASVVSHRCGGYMAAENTVTGLEKAIDTGADSAEIDIQRTKDGYYIINHDNTFKRLAGDEHYVDELTLEEVKELRITKDKNSKGKEDTFATLEEILETAKDKIHIYVELKGKTADYRMASEAFQIVSNYGMLDQVTFISMKYSVVSYLESKHPEANTGYLCYSAFGDIEKLQVDGLYLEEEMATPVTIGRIQKAGKKAVIWTVNDSFGMLRCFARNADGIITDDARMAVGIRNFLRGDYFPDQYKKEAEYMTRILLRIIFKYWP